ncbi:MAG: phosphatidylglycerol lysyltransferase domain-containing protein [Elusimicrobia bacterium]|nr:phosphatidylglycerol lysyltransferase domain-containing protein [Elusimicrobiota bacterium]
MHDQQSISLSDQPTTSRGPIFPNFKPLEMSDQPAIEAFTQRFEPYSDFCFSTLTFYNINNCTHWCWYNGNLVLRFCDPFGPGTFLTFLGVEQAAATAETLIGYALEMGYSPTLWRVPEITAKVIARKSEGLHIEEDRDGFDYIYRIDSLAQLEGSALRELRRDVCRFNRQHPHYSFVTLDLCDVTIHAQLQSTITAWQSNKSTTGMVQNYCHALKTCIRYVRHFNLLCVGAVIGDSLVGFILCERLNKSWLLPHFAVSNPKFSSVPSRLLHHLAQSCSKLGCTHLNYQEDLGVPGLRYFKKKCVPSGFLRKFSVMQKDARP